MVPRGRQNPAHPGFTAPAEPYDCAQCIRTHAARHGFPPLHPANAEAWDLYMTIQDQQRVGMDVLALDHGAIETAFRIYGVPEADRRLLYEKLLVMDHECQRRRQEEREQEARRREKPGAR